MSLFYVVLVDLVDPLDYSAFPFVLLVYFLESPFLSSFAGSSFFLESFLGSSFLGSSFLGSSFFLESFLDSSFLATFFLGSSYFLGSSFFKGSSIFLATSFFLVSFLSFLGSDCFLETGYSCSYFWSADKDYERWYMTEAPITPPATYKR